MKNDKMKKYGTSVWDWLKISGTRIVSALDQLPRDNQISQLIVGLAPILQPSEPPFFSDFGSLSTTLIHRSADRCEWSMQRAWLL